MLVLSEKCKISQKTDKKIVSEKTQICEKIDNANMLEKWEISQKINKTKCRSPEGKSGNGTMQN